MLPVWQLDQLLGSQGNSGCMGLWTHHLVPSTISLYTVKALRLVSYLFFRRIYQQVSAECLSVRGAYMN